MKLLLTGFTQRMTNSQKLRYDYLTSVFVLRDVLTRLGHDVDHRSVTPGEDLSGYDRALIGIGPTKSFTSRFVPGSAWVYNQLPGRVLLYCDDWSIEKTGYDFRNTLARWDKWVKFFTDAGPVKGQELDAPERRADVQEMLEDITVSKDRKLLAPMFNWGAHSLLMEGNLPSTLVAWDPTPFVAGDPQPAAGSDDVVGQVISAKQRRWVMATLQKNTKVPKGQWPVHQVGNKRDGQAYLPEDQILELYRQSWGVICPPYSKAGSGWWRYRYQAAADAGSVLWLAASDSAGMSGQYQFTRQTYEEMQDYDLKETARLQKDWFYANTATAEQTLQVIQEVLG